MQLLTSRRGRRSEQQRQQNADAQQRVQIAGELAQAGRKQNEIDVNALHLQTDAEEARQFFRQFTSRRGRRSEQQRQQIADAQQRLRIAEEQQRQQIVNAPQHVQIAEEPEVQAF